MNTQEHKKLIELDKEEASRVKKPYTTCYKVTYDPGAFSNRTIYVFADSYHEVELKFNSRIKCCNILSIENIGAGIA